MASLKCNSGVIVSSRVALLGVIALTISGADVAPGGFCERLAPQLSMKETAFPLAGQAQSTREWEVSLMTLGKALFGGTIGASFGIRPIGKWTPDEIERLHDVCKQTKKGVTCNIAGPVHLDVGIKNGNFGSDALPGERAIVEFRKTAIYCHDL